MKIKINSSHDKKVYYCVYAAEGDKRALLTKGGFIGSTEFELPYTGREIIVRIRPKRGIKSIPSIVKMILLDAFLYFETKNIELQKNNCEVFNLFDEIRITDINISDTMEINYSPSPVSELNSNSIYKKVRVEYFTCKTHPFKQEFKKAKSASLRFSFVLSICIVVVIICIAFLVGVVIRSC